MKLLSPYNFPGINGLLTLPPYNSPDYKKKSKPTPFRIKKKERKKKPTIQNDLRALSRKVPSYATKARALIGKHVFLEEKKSNQAQPHMVGSTPLPLPTIKGSLFTRKAPIATTEPQPLSNPQQTPTSYQEPNLPFSQPQAPNPKPQPLPPPLSLPTANEGAEPHTPSLLPSASTTSTTLAAGEEGNNMALWNTFVVGRRSCFVT